MSYETVTARLIRRFGQTVTLEGDGTALGGGRAILRPLLDGKAQFTPTPLGTERAERSLCLGESALPFPETPDGVVLRSRGVAYEVVSARMVTLGALPLYWRAVLRRRDREEGEL